MRNRVNQERNPIIKNCVRTCRSCSAVLRNPRLCMTGLNVLSFRNKMTLFIVLFTVFFFSMAFLRDACEIRFEDGRTYESMWKSMRLIRCSDLRMDKTIRNYHFIHLTGNFFNHEHLRTWIAYHKMNVSYYNNKPVKWNDIYHFFNATSFVEQYRPHFTEEYQQLTIVEKADYLRYLVVSIEGGIYSDADVALKVKLNRWLSDYGYYYDVKDMDFVIGLEFAHKVNISATVNGILEEVNIPFQLCQWTFFGGHKSFVFQRVVEAVEKKLFETNQSVGQNEVMVKTGPVIFTQSVLDTISRYAIPSGMNEDGVPNALGYIDTFFEYGKEITLEIPSEDENGVMGKKLVRGILLPESAFNGYLVKHFFHGFWKGSLGKIKDRS